MIEEIIKGCRKGHRKSQKALYEKYYAYGMSIALRYAENREQAAAILNDSFMKVFANIKKYDERRDFKPWLRRIIINTAIDVYHKEQKKTDSVHLESVDALMAEEETVTSGITYEEIIGMMQQLSPTYRAVLNLFVIEGFSHEEIAKKLGISVGTSKSNLAKARRNLRVILEKNLI